MRDGTVTTERTWPVTLRCDGIRYSFCTHMLFLPVACQELESLHSRGRWEEEKPPALAWDVLGFIPELVGGTALVSKPRAHVGTEPAQLSLPSLEAELFQRNTSLWGKWWILIKTRFVRVVFFLNQIYLLPSSLKNHELLEINYIRPFDWASKSDLKTEREVTVGNSDPAKNLTRTSYWDFCV